MDIIFEFNFPHEYPFLPPVVNFYTNDGSTRFNPNFYTCGKVCLSLLNTWRGDGWTSCQSIRSILIILQSTLNDKPLCNEPGINENHKDFNKYNNMIIYKNIEVAIIGVLLEKYLDQKFYIFKDIIIKTYIKNKNNIKKNLKNISLLLDDNSIQKFGVYVSEYLVNFTYLNKLLDKIDNMGKIDNMCKIDNMGKIDNMDNMDKIKI